MLNSWHFRQIVFLILKYDFWSFWHLRATIWYTSLQIHMLQCSRLNHAQLFKYCFKKKSLYAQNCKIANKLLLSPHMLALLRPLLVSEQNNKYVARKHQNKELKDFKMQRQRWKSRHYNGLFFFLLPPLIRKKNSFLYSFNVTGHSWYMLCPRAWPLQGPLSQVCRKVDPILVCL